MSSVGVSGAYSAGETPLPIPNREVKPRSADGTAGLPRWESRSVPGTFVWRAGGAATVAPPARFFMHAKNFANLDRSASSGVLPFAD
jgi:hypothetical protein